MIIGYARLTENIHTDTSPLQILTDSGCDRLYHDSAMVEPGVLLPQRAAAAKAAAGGTLVVCGMEHLGVSLLDVMRFIVQLREDGTRLRVIDVDLNSDTPRTIYDDADLFIVTYGLLQSEGIGYGISRAKKNGATWGRKTALSSKDKKAALALWAATGDADAAAEKFNITTRTLYRYREEDTGS